MKKGLFHMEKAAIGGHLAARYNLGTYDCNEGRMDRAVKHFIIAATLGCVDSIDLLKECYAHGDVSKKDFASVLRAHQAAVDATKSPQRKAVDEFYAKMGYNKE
jgi:TPR repeat protein